MSSPNETRYKGFLIRDCSYELEAGEWIPQAIVFEPTRRGMREHPPFLAPADTSFPTQHQAEEHALDWAKRFVNQILGEGR